MKGELPTGFWWGNTREGGNLVDPGVDGRIMLKWISEKWDGGHELDPSDSELRQVMGCCEYGNEPSGSIKCGNFLTS